MNLVVITINPIFNFNIITLNVNGQSNWVKQRKQISYLKANLKADIVLLQETHSVHSQEKVIRAQWGWKDVFHSHGQSNSRGVGTYFKPSLNAKILDVESSSDGRWLYTKFQLHENKFAIMNIYCHNDVKNQIEFYYKIGDFLRTKHEKDTFVIIAGDFNVARTESDRKGSATYRHSKVNHIIDCLMDEFCLSDIWRSKNPYKKSYTWSRQGGQRSRIDLILASSELIQSTKFAGIADAICTDHRAVKVQITGDKYIKRGPGLYKLNSDILEEKEYQNLVETVINNEIEASGEDEDPCILWDNIKRYVILETQDYCKKRAKRHKAAEKALLQRLNKLEQTLHSLKQEEIDEYQLIKKELESLYDAKTRGAILRSRAQFLSQGEKGTKYFFGLERRNFTTQCIYQLQDENGKIEEDHSAIQKQIKNYYENLFSSSEREPTEEEYGEFLNDTDIPKLTEDQRDQLERDITTEEIKTALSQMSNNKSPGLDGITTEWYKKFWNQIEPYLVPAIKEEFNGGLFPNTNRGVIRLIPKPNRSLLQISNWRPITLLNVQYKIEAKVLANRLKVVIHDLIHSDQAGFIEGRYIGENIRLLDAVITEMDQGKQHGLLLSLDIMKAYDRCKWPFLFRALRAFGIGEGFITWINYLYQNSNTQVINNGYTTDGFKLERSVRQGCPASCQLFLLAIEILSIAIRKNNKISGLNLPNNVLLKLMQFADDTTVFLKDEESLLELKEVLQRFSIISGLTVNESKTECIGLGLWKDLKKEVYGFKIVPKPIKVFGIWFSHDKKLMQDLNTKGKLEKMKTSLNSWHARGLTIQGRILVLKALGLSQCTYTMINTVIPSNLLDEINKYVFEFVWGGKNRSRIRKTVLIQDYVHGGYKAPDIYSMHKALKYSWIPRLLRGKEAENWAKLTLENLDRVGGLDYLLACNFSTELLPIKVNAFLEQVLEAHTEVNPQKVKTRNDVVNQVINNNKHIVIGEKSLFMPQLIERNMDCVGKWFDHEGTALQYHVIKDSFGIKISWMQYLQIINAIPKEWKCILKQQAGASTNPKRSQVLVFTTEEAKKALIYKKYESPAAISAWKKKMPQPRMDENFWRSQFMLARKITKESKLQVFQYKVLHRIIATKAFLHKAKLSDSPNCQDCPQTQETLEHLLFECPKARTIWNDLSTKFSETEDTRMPLNLQTCLFGLKSRKTEIRKWNYLALILRFFIYKCRINSNTPTKIAFYLILKSQLEVLYKVAKQNNKEQEFLDAWRPWMQ